MPETAGTRSLEDILASIRQSLADETVDGLVQLSAAAAAAARAEAAGEPRQHREPVLAPAGEGADAGDITLKDKLAGALAVEEELTVELSGLASDQHEADEVEHTDDVEVSAQAADTAPTEPLLSKLWFLRPGAPEEPANPDKASTPLRLDAFPERDLTEPPSEKTAAALFALSARAIVGDSPAPKPPVQAAPAVSPDDSSAAGARRPVPRLDATQIEMINKLKASSAAAVESITSETDVVDLRPAATPVAKEPDAVERPSSSEAGAGEEDLEAQAPEVEAGGDEPPPSALLSLPERLTPLFVGANDKSRPIVSAPPLLRGAHAELRGEPAEGAPPPAEETAPAAPAEEEEAVAAAPDHEPDLEEVLEPASAAPADYVDAAAERATENGSAGVQVPSDIHTLKTVAAPVPPPSPDIDPDVPGTRPLEEMIASVLEPVLHRLLEKNLGPMIEELVRREVAKALDKPRDV